jgi:hypothetical protein
VAAQFDLFLFREVRLKAYRLIEMKGLKTLELMELFST